MTVVKGPILACTEADIDSHGRGLKSCLSRTRAYLLIPFGRQTYCAERVCAGVVLLRRAFRGAAKPVVTYARPAWVSP